MGDAMAASFALRAGRLARPSRIAACIADAAAGPTRSHGERADPVSGAGSGQECRKPSPWTVM
jgi:hypothetical protein